MAASRIQPTRQGAIDRPIVKAARIPGSIVLRPDRVSDRLDVVDIGDIAEIRAELGEGTGRIEHPLENAPLAGLEPFD